MPEQQDGAGARDQRATDAGRADRRGVAWENLSLEQAMHAVAVAPDPQAAYQDFKAALARQYEVSAEEVEQFYTSAMLTQALARRTRLEALWPDAPRGCHLYASFCRSIHEYGRLPQGAQVREQEADWPSHTPHSYLATLEPVTLPQVELLRLPQAPEHRA